jgi:large conductance mechanosensitive channel
MNSKTLFESKKKNKFDHCKVIELALPKCMAEDVPVKKSFIQEFMDFLQKFSVIGLAIAFVIGQAASKLISAFVNDLITPFIGLLTPNVGDLNKVGFTVGNSTFSYGDLISNLINFLIIALVIFVAYRQLSKIGLMKDPVKG